MSNREGLMRYGIAVSMVVFFGLIGGAQLIQMTLNGSLNA